MNTKKWAVSIVMVLVALVVLRFSFTFIQSFFRGMMMQKAMMAHVIVSEVKEAEVLPVIEAPGRIRSYHSVQVIPKVSGTLVSRHFKDGDFVKKGQLLLTIDPNKFKIAINSANANLQSSIAKAKKADLDFARAKELLARDYIAKATYDESLANRDMAHAQVEANRAALADAKRLYNYSQIKAEISGKTGMLQRDPGNYITTEGGPILDIMSYDPIEVVYPLDSKQFYELRNNTIMPTVKQNKPIKLEIILPDGSVYSKSGEVYFYDNKISESTGTIELKAKIPNPDNVLIAGDFVGVRIYSNTPTKRIVVPQSAVLQDQSGQYLYTVDKNNCARLVRIKTDGQHEKNWIIREGVKLGDKIITNGVVSVRDKSPVKILTSEEIQAFEKLGKSVDDINASPEEYKTMLKKPNLFERGINKIKKMIKKIFKRG